MKRISWKEQRRGFIILVLLGLIFFGLFSLNQFSIERRFQSLRLEAKEKAKRNEVLTKEGSDLTERHRQVDFSLDQVAQLRTKQVLELAYENPFLIEVAAFSSSHEGVQALAKSNTVVRVLTERKEDLNLIEEEYRRIKELDQPELVDREVFLEGLRSVLMQN